MQRNNIPTVPLCLGLAGLVPFIWGALSVLLPDLGLAAARLIGARFVGPYVQIAYGSVILAFMSGVLWGFATRAEGGVAGTGYALSVLPALWAFLFVGGGPVSATMYLIFGFLGLLMLDAVFWHQGLAPPWWMKLRLMLSVVVIACLSVSVI
ncbi:DUF3429 domain-containing protein [Oceaniglobus trochenteri]|uniref:DUF3429 domain-containing protein n=1 Tax=Oceaniglobus trochenteri TaxID=2763260 RepID=UPI001CFF951E|nr:DUF3429 domain-containing protein [Oceaniglobus trochenteri]